MIANPSHAQVFMRSTKGDPNFEFLYDAERMSLVGKKFREISEKLRAEKNVQNVCNDVMQSAVCLISFSSCISDKLCVIISRAVW